MRKIVGGFAISLDGYIEGPHGEHDWIKMDKEFDFSTHMKRFDTFLIGRRSYEAIIKAGSDYFHDIKNYVFSHSLTHIQKGYTLVKEDIKTFTERIRAQDGKDIAAYGGPGLLTSLINENLLDEIILSVMPVVLGNGKPMLNELSKRVPLILTDSKKFSSGVVMLYYQLKNN